MHRHIQLHQLHHRLWAPPNISPTKGFGIGMSSASDFPFAWGYWLRFPGLLRDDDNLKVPKILQAQYIPKKTSSNKIINFKPRAATNLQVIAVCLNMIYTYIYIPGMAILRNVKCSSTIGCWGPKIIIQTNAWICFSVIYHGYLAYDQTHWDLWNIYLQLNE